MELPDPPERKVLGPSLDDPPKRKFPLRALLILPLIVGLGVGAFFLLGLGGPSGPTPDQRAQAITDAAAKDALLVVAGEDSSGEANARIKAVVEQGIGDCEFIAGTMTTGHTAGVAARNAEALIAGAKTQLGAQAEEYGFGFTVVRGLRLKTETGRHRIPDQYIALVAAIRCAAPSPSMPGGFGR